MGTGHSTPTPTTTTLALCVVAGTDIPAYNYTPNAAIPQQVQRQCDAMLGCNPAQILEAYNDQITCPSGYVRPYPLTSVDNFEEDIPIASLIWCKDSTGQIFASGDSVCGPQTTRVIPNYPSTPFTDPTFGNIVAIAQNGIELYNDANEPAGTATVQYGPQGEQGEPIFNINITDPSIDEIINIETDEVTTWAMTNAGLVLTLKSGKTILTITITYQLMRLNMLIEVKEPVPHQGVCGYQTTAKIYLLSQPIELISSAGATPSSQ